MSINKNSLSDSIDSSFLATQNLDELLSIALDLTILAYEDPRLLRRLTNAKYIESGLDGFPILIEKIGSHLIVAFRGTNDAPLHGDVRPNQLTNFLGNLIKDLNTQGGVSLRSYPIFKDRLPDGQLDLVAHGSFLSELAKNYLVIRKEIDYYKGNVNDLIITGHSAGGALATLFYYIYTSDKVEPDKKIHVSQTITFGSPRCIKNDSVSVGLYSSTCPFLLRVFNSLDIITYLPFNKPLAIPLSIANGFEHVGRPIPLDTNVLNNSLDALVIQIINGNKESYKQLIKNYTLDEIRQNELMRLITSNEYMAVLMAGSLQCISNVTLRELTDEVIVLYTQELFNRAKELRTYREKCSLGKPYFLEDLLLRYKVGETEAQQNLSIVSLIGGSLRYNVQGIQNHLTSKYEQNLNILLNRQVELRLDFVEHIGSTARLLNKQDEHYVPPEPIPVTPNEVEINLMKEVEKDILSGKIIGITNDIPAGNLIDIK